MTEKTSPLNVAVIKQKIDKGEVKVKGKSTAKQNKAQNKARSVSGVNSKISDAQIVSWLKEQDSAVTSTQLRDGVGFKSRTQARRVMRRLAKQGVVRIAPKQVSDKRRVFTFKMA